MAEQANKGGPPLGNKNAIKNKPWADALRKALARSSNNDVDAGLASIADKVVALANAGDQWAVTEIANRADGRPVQQLEHSGLGGGPIQTLSASDIANMPPEKFALVVKAFEMLGLDPRTAEIPARG